MVLLNTVALREAVKRGRFVQNFSRFHQRWPENLHRSAILQDWPAALGGEAATYLSYFNGEQRGNTLKDQIQGRLCSFRERICLRHLRRWEHPISSQCCFPLKNKSKYKYTPLLTFWQVPQGLEMKGSMQVQSSVVIYMLIVFPSVVSSICTDFSDVLHWKNTRLL